MIRTLFFCAIGDLSSNHLQFQSNLVDALLLCVCMHALLLPRPMLQSYNISISPFLCYRDRKRENEVFRAGALPFSHSISSLILLAVKRREMISIATMHD